MLSMVFLLAGAATVQGVPAKPGAKAMKATAVPAAAAEPVPYIVADTAALIAALGAVRAPLTVADDCTERDPRLKMRAEYEALDDAFQASLDMAEATWPNFERSRVYDSGSAAAAKRKCGRKDVATALQSGKDALARYTAMYRQMTAPMAGRGAWAGPMKLCRASVTGADLVTDAITKKPALSVRLNAAARTPWETVAQQSEGRPMAVRLDGTIVSEVKVFTAGKAPAFQIVGPAAGILTALAQRTKDPCR